MACAPVREIYSSDPIRRMPNATIPDAVSKFMATACKAQTSFYIFIALKINDF